MTLLRGDEAIMEAINERIKRLRVERRFSQQQVADFLGLYRTAVVDMESGKRKITTDELRQFCELFEVPADALLNDEPVDKMSQVFMRQFGELDADDQREILELIEFKKMRKA